jgi:monomeric sarcosine oxidase
MRIGVIGLGATGTAAARFLAEGGHRVTGFEQFRLDHDRGSSYGGSRIIRKVYPDALYASLMEAAYPLWEALERQSGDALFLRCGGFFFGPEGHPEMTAAEAALSEVGVPYERLSAAEARDRFPAFRLRGDEYGILEPQSGLLRASRCVRANARGARAAGAELREGVRIEALDPHAAGVRVRAEGEWHVFDRLVVTAGPWMRELLAPFVSLPLTVTRQQYAHFAVLGERSWFAPERFPVWIDMARSFYGFPEHDDAPGAKVALHVAGVPHDPDNPDREPSEADNDVLRDYTRERLPELSAAVTFAKVCLYTMTPDEDFIIDRLPGDPRVVFVSGCSGHGFKFTVLLGQLAARLAVVQEPGCDLGRFSLRRFGR